MNLFPFNDDLKTDVIITFDEESRSDDSFALTYALLSERLRIHGIIATHYAIPGSVSASSKEANTVLNLLKIDIPILPGSETLFVTESSLQPESKGADLIIETARKMPVTILCMTVLTDVAIAIARDPSIVQNLKIIWAGGGTYPKGAQYEPNIMNDRDAANFVIQAGCEFWQIPKNVYRMLHASFSELYLRVQPCGAIGEHLYHLIMERAFDSKRPLRSGCYWVLGNLSIIACLLCDFSMDMEERTAPTFTRHCVYMDVGTKNTIQVLQNMDTRFVFEDFYSKLTLFSRS